MQGKMQTKTTIAYRSDLAAFFTRFHLAKIKTGGTSGLTNTHEVELRHDTEMTC